MTHMTSFWKGYFFGGVFVMFVAVYFPGGYISEGSKAIKECEKQLPRDKHCVLTAIPEEN